ncbi:MAG: hypothetical protein UX04_C0002G0084 [Microgenomates group bacterium GW2011_GWF2_45_18]|nr:MAG: hypothetical protein UW18_C0001G0013 [Microgenomates group bacterium GW2011_GWF1_44_10]KKU01941.1 MAG: hypothetical protein UX04_C0002G0084 [Microgenomates group bacterium GW2011_GWF2_45_18]OGJ41467.1 MAG: hypothetical protein A2378_00060 [Candidatus Pacebacteria bacterium RIFOXYB1_FULL_44_10]HAU98745.1 hypothetical protein [Candidatus Paceibacterota bacterium]HAX01435.1 hypothetical protein [Candidatus Paceibacterota bacterium]
MSELKRLYIAGPVLELLFVEKNPTRLFKLWLLIVADLLGPFPISIAITILDGVLKQQFTYKDQPEAFAMGMAIIAILRLLVHKKES